LREKSHHSFKISNFSLLAQHGYYHLYIISLGSNI